MRVIEPSRFEYFYEYTGFSVLQDGKLLFAGGIHGDLPTASVWILDP